MNFKDRKYTLYDCDKEHLQGRNYHYILQGINIFCWLNVVKNVYRFRVIRTAFWLMPALVTQAAANGFKEHQGKFVLRIDLRDSGDESDVTLLSGKVLTVKNTDFQTGSQSDLVGGLERWGLRGLQLFPLKIGSKEYVIDKTGSVEHPEVFKAVCNGFNIDLSVMQDARGRKDIIDI